MSKFTISSPTLLYPSPSPSVASGTLVDPEHLPSNEQPSATSSRTSSPARPAKIIPPPPPPMTPAAQSIASDRAKWMPPNEPIEFAKRPARPDYLSKKKHVPRPPNAFMLFRSMVINKEIPKIENRQQNVSRIAGEIWNVLDDDIKQAWHDKALEYQIEHKLKHPDYKFAPSRKAQVKPKEEEEHGGMTTEEYIRHLREKYTGVMGPAVAPARKRKPKTRKPKTDDEEFQPTPKRSRTRSRRALEVPESPSPRPHRSEPTFAPAASHLAPPLPPWRLLHSTSTHMPGSSSLDLMMADEYTRMTSATYAPVASSSISASHDFVEGSSRRKGRYDNSTATNAMSFGHIPMPSPFNSTPGGYDTFAHNMLGLGDLTIPNASFYQPFYGSSHSHVTDTPAAPAPTPSDAAETFGGYEFNFSDDILANIVGAALPVPTDGPVSSHDETRAHLPSSSVSPAAPTAEVFSHPPTPSKPQKNVTPTTTPIATPPATA